LTAVIRLQLKPGSFTYAPPQEPETREELSPHVKPCCAVRRAPFPELLRCLWWALTLHPDHTLLRNNLVLHVLLET